MFWPKVTVPLSGRVLPVIISIIVVLPAPLAPYEATQLAGVDIEVKVADCLESFERHIDVLHIQQDAVRGIEAFAYTGYQKIENLVAPEQSSWIGIGIHADCLLQMPVTPLGRYRVENTNSAPNANIHNSGSATVNQLFA